ncbi:hypothetical protein KVR01_003165 [Diaporthe batatas]|uniref:uncharacterized protein n=1 Tax=Diaporthe batatas TaxID=748121 RepID=UPI001D03F99F|nr:uncharacterized protein KVR01_003165 [Diaporthe batatas]KAG8167476.1 hypothetical protein KVR01_003165 [Diaporthe batatas]
MVSIKSLAAATLAAVPTVMGKIDSFTAPAEAAAGSNITATFQTSIYIQNWVDFGVVLAYKSQPTPFMTTRLERKLDIHLLSTSLYGKEALEYPYTFDLDVAIPEGFAAGEYVLRAAIPYLVGASGTIDWNILDSNITISA